MNELYKLNTGFHIPLIGFGTFQIHGAELIKHILDIALDSGYRHIDTAVVYRNEHHIGAALQELLPKYNLTRGDIFITTKLIPTANKGEDHVVDLIKTSLKNLQTSYIDLYLIHWPGVSGLPVEHPDNKTYRINTWKVFMKLQSSGIIRSIGVSNFEVRHLNEILSDSSLVRPSVNQVEWHPHYNIPKLIDLCRKENIFLQAYSSLGSSNYSSLRTDPKIVSIAEKLNKSPSQILLRWAFQQKIGIIPKARSKDHITENIDLNFEIPEEEMNLLHNMRIDEKYAWNPENVV